PKNMFPTGNFTPAGVSLTQSNPAFNSTLSVSFTDSAFAYASQVYNYEYTVTSNGTQGTTGARSVVSSGVMRLSAGRGSFADYLMFTNIHTMPDGSNIWFTSSGYFEGRVHTNTTFRFQGPPTFEHLGTS